MKNLMMIIAIILCTVTVTSAQHVSIGVPVFSEKVGTDYGFIGNFQSRDGKGSLQAIVTNRNILGEFNVSKIEFKQIPGEFGMQLFFAAMKDSPTKGEERYANNANVSLTYSFSSFQNGLTFATGIAVISEGLSTMQEEESWRQGVTGWRNELTYRVQNVDLFSLMKISLAGTYNEVLYPEIGVLLVVKTPWSFLNLQTNFNYKKSTVDSHFRMNVGILASLTELLEK